MQNKKQLKTILSVTAVIFSILFFIVACNMKYKDSPAENQNLEKVPDAPYQGPAPDMATLETVEAEVKPPETGMVSIDLIPETIDSVTESADVNFQDDRLYASLSHHIEDTRMVSAPEPEFYFISLLGCLVLMFSIKQQRRMDGNTHG